MTVKGAVISGLERVLPRGLSFRDVLARITPLRSREHQQEPETEISRAGRP